MVAIPEGNDRGKRLYCEVLGTTLELQPQDLSQAGVFIPMPDPFELDREIDILLRSPIGELNARCHVVQVISRERARSEGRSSGCGVLFVDLADDQRAWIGLTLVALAMPAPAPTPTPAAPAAASPRFVPETVPSRPPAPRSIPATRSVVRSIAPPTARRAARTGGSAQRPDTVEQLERELAALQNKTPAAILGLPEGADAPATHRAFLESSKRYHPHAYAQYDDPKLSRLATELFIAHKRAFAQLCPRPEAKANRPPTAPLVVSTAPPAAVGTTPSQQPPAKAPRPSFAPERGTGTAPKPEAAAQAGPRDRTLTSPAALPAKRKRIAEAEMAFAAGLKHLTANRFDDAAAELARAHELAPERPETLLWVRICRARKLKADGELEAASAAYRAVLEIEADNREALDMVDAERAPRKLPRLMQRLFGSGDD